MKRRGASYWRRAREQNHEEREEEERGTGHATRHVASCRTIKNFTRATLIHGGPPQVRERGPSREGRGEGRAPGEATLGERGGQGVLNLTAGRTGEGCPVSHVATWEGNHGASPAARQKHSRTVRNTP